MSTANYNVLAMRPVHPAPSTPGAPTKALHRLQAVRQAEGISQSVVARHLRTSLSEVRWQERQTSDMLLSTLYDWQKVLGVPVAELLVESNEPLSPPVMKRAQMVRLMKTARAILQRSRETTIRRMAQVLVDHLIDFMPELADVTPWPEIGQPRSLDDLGQVVHRRLSDAALEDGRR